MSSATAHGGAPPSFAVMSPEDIEMFEESRRLLRRRWELASVLNFLRVFEPVIGKELKMSSEEIEAALIRPNHVLSKIHITLLKGIPPVNKNLSTPDAWVTVLCKKLAEWWPWVAEGEVPVTAGKGEEISRYKELDPVIRLSMLKALCELRTEQDDLISHINDALKQGKDISQFRAHKISENKTGISFWYDGDSVMGYRLYKEVNKPQLKSKFRGKRCIDLPPINSEWETLATNLDEFRKFSEELSSSSDVAEGAVYQTLETEVIPALEKLRKKQERDLKRRQREETLINDYHSYAAGRTCRTRKPVKYTFDDYDRVIEEAINVSREGKDRKVERNGTKLHEGGKRSNRTTNGDLLKNGHMEDGSPRSTDEDEQNDRPQNEDSDADEDTKYGHKSNTNDDTEDSDSDKDEQNDGQQVEVSDTDENTDSSHRNNKSDDTEDSGSDSDNSEEQNDHVSDVLKTKDGSDSSSGHLSPEPNNLRAKNRMRQRPTQNSALKSSIIPDSDDGSGSDNASLDSSSEGSQLEVPDSEDDMSS